MSYGDYLQLDAILSAQKPLSPAHNEMLFIVQHQTSELWMKLMLHELRAAIGCAPRRAGHRLQDAGAREQDHGAAGARLGRAGHHDTARIQRHPALPGHSSGFQSYQYRCIEFALGNKNAAMLKPHAHRPTCWPWCRPPIEAPSLYDEALRLLARRGLAVPASHCSATGPSPTGPATRSSKPGSRCTAIPSHWDLYQLGEELTDLEDAFACGASAMSPPWSG
jgi:tryptophan 2,3-dioxygenase